MTCFEKFDQLLSKVANFVNHDMTCHDMVVKVWSTFMTIGGSTPGGYTGFGPPEWGPGGSGTTLQKNRGVCLWSAIPKQGV